MNWKCKGIPLHTIKACRGNGGMIHSFLTCILDGGEWSGSGPGRFTTMQLSSTHLIWGWMEFLKTILIICSCLDLNPGSSIPYIVTAPTDLSLPRIMNSSLARRYWPYVLAFSHILKPLNKTTELQEVKELEVFHEIYWSQVNGAAVAGANDWGEAQSQTQSILVFNITLPLKSCQYKTARKLRTNRDGFTFFGKCGPCSMKCLSRI